MPATGAIARTAVNVRAGAQTRLAAITHSVVILGVIYLATGAVSAIPLAALAGVLMVTADADGLGRGGPRRADAPPGPTRSCSWSPR